MTTRALLHRPTHRTVARAKPGSPPRSVGVGLMALAVGLAANTVVGPLLLDLGEYPISDTLRNETIGLELVSLVLVAPWTALAGILVLRGRRFGTVLAMAPAAYVAHMFVQYLAGIPSLSYGPQHLLQLGLLIVAGWILVEAVLAAADTVTVPHGAAARRWSWLLLAMAGFIVLRWTPGLVGAFAGTDLPDAYAGDPGMHWTIFLLDLGVIVPCSVAAARGLRAERPSAAVGLHALVGWFTLVPVSVLAMALTKQVNGDPLASPVDSAMFAVATVLYLAVTVTLYAPLRRR
jgi:hypothetical protein